MEDTKHEEERMETEIEVGTLVRIEKAGPAWVNPMDSLRGKVAVVSAVVPLSDGGRHYQLRECGRVNSIGCFWPWVFDREALESVGAPRVGDKVWAPVEESTK